MSFEGLLLNERYQLLRLLGSGGTGDVYVANDLQEQQEVAIKIIRAEISYGGIGIAQEEERLFRREAKMIARLNHPRILALYDYGQQQQNNLTLYYLVMPYQPEGSFADWLRKRGGITPLEPDDVVAVIQQAAEALQHAHDHQVIHQDIKPSNFLVQTSEEGSSRPALILSDFGIARLSMGTSSASQSIRGTPTYMAPEQWDGQPVYATDQYGLAVMAYELLTGRPPFQGNVTRMMYQHLDTPPEPPSSINAALSSQIDLVLMKALAKRPEQRFPSVVAFAEALEQAVKGSLSAEALAGLSAPSGTELSQGLIEQSEPFMEKTGLSYDEIVKLRAKPSTIGEMESSLSTNSEQKQNSFVPVEESHEQFTRNRASDVQNSRSGRQQKQRRQPVLLITAAILAIVMVLAGVTASLGLRGITFAHLPGKKGQATQGTGLTPTTKNALATRQVAFQSISPTSTAQTLVSSPTSSPPTPSSTSGIQPSPTQIPTSGSTPSPIPTKPPAPPPTQKPTVVPATLSVSPSSLSAGNDCTWQYDEMNGQHGGGTWSCTASLQNPSSTQSLSWSASSSGFPSAYSAVSFAQSNGTLAPGQSVTVSFLVSVLWGGSCFSPPQGDIIFSGPLNTANVPWTCTTPTFTVSPVNINAQQDCQQGNGEWDCTVTATMSSQGQLLLSASSSNSSVGSDTTVVMLTSPSSMVGQFLIYIPTTACPSTSTISYGGTVTGSLTC